LKVPETGVIRDIFVTEKLSVLDAEKMFLQNMMQQLFFAGKKHRKELFKWVQKEQLRARVSACSLFVLNRVLWA